MCALIYQSIKEIAVVIGWYWWHVGPFVGWGETRVSIKQKSSKRKKKAEEEIR